MSRTPLSVMLQGQVMSKSNKPACNAHECKLFPGPIILQTKSVGASARLPSADGLGLLPSATEQSTGLDAAKSDRLDPPTSSNHAITRYKS